MVQIFNIATFICKKLHINTEITIHYFTVNTHNITFVIINVLLKFKIFRVLLMCSHHWTSNRQNNQLKLSSFLLMEI